MVMEYVFVPVFTTRLLFRDETFAKIFTQAFNERNIYRVLEAHENVNCCF